MRVVLVLIFGFLSYNVIGQNSFVLSDIEIIGNKTTKEHIILREVTFNHRDTIFFSDTAKHVFKTENNLLNTSLFNFIKVTFVDTLGVWVARIKLQERWYLWPKFVIGFQDRNFSEWWKTRDFSRIDYGLIINRNNFLGLNQTLQGQFHYGFTKKIGFKYQIPYLTKKQRGGFNISASYGTQNEVFSGLNDNKMVYIKNDSDIILNDFNAIFEYTLRTGFYNLQTFAIEFKSLSSAHVLKNSSEGYFGNTEGRLKYISLMYWYKIDKRFSKNYPLTGYFFDFKFRQFGLGFFDKSDLFVTQIASNYRIYKNILKRHFIAGSAYINISPKKDIPFRFQQGLGFHEYVRGYEPYVIYGQASFLAKANYKFQLVSPKEFTLPIIRKWKKFSKAHFAMYWNIYSDFGYVHQKFSSQILNNKLVWGLGTGIDWVSYYDMVIRTEVSINKEGKSGFYLNFVAPI